MKEGLDRKPRECMFCIECPVTPLRDTPSSAQQEVTMNTVKLLKVKKLLTSIHPRHFKTKQNIWTTLSLNIVHAVKQQPTHTNGAHILL